MVDAVSVDYDNYSYPGKFHIVMRKFNKYLSIGVMVVSVLCVSMVVNVWERI